MKVNHMKQNKILIIIPYYNRPEMVKNGLLSIRNNDYENWFLAIIDDGSDYPVEESVKDIFGEYYYRKGDIKIYKTNDAIENKSICGGSIHGKYMNLALTDFDSDVAIMLCDDDALYPSYLTNLNKWFNENPREVWCYSHNILYNPLIETPLEFNDEEFLKYEIRVYSSMSKDSFGKTSMSKEEFISYLE